MRMMDEPTGPIVDILPIRTEPVSKPSEEITPVANEPPLKVDDGEVDDEIPYKVEDASQEIINVLAGNVGEKCPT